MSHISHGQSGIASFANFLQNVIKTYNAAENKEKGSIAIS